MTKKFFFIALLTGAVALSVAQNKETANDTSSYKIRHEFGLNATFLLKQVLNFSGNNFTTLPYDLTYKTIFKNTAVRAGAGFVYQNTGSSSTNSGTSTIPGPDPIPKEKNESSSVFFRAGFEWRKKLGKRMMLYYGADAIVETNRSVFQNHTLFNNLPGSYQFTSSTDNIKANGAGGGVVAGLQCMLTSRIGLFTECPIYMLYKKTTENTSTYSNFKSSSSSTYNSSYSTSTTTTTTSKVSLTLPVTLYLSIKI